MSAGRAWTASNPIRGEVRRGAAAEPATTCIRTPSMGATYGLVSADGARSWRGRGEVVARSWRGRGEVVARSWRGRGEVVARSWLCYDFITIRSRWSNGGLQMMEC